jgi:hypothetical protein
MRDQGGHKICFLMKKPCLLSFLLRRRALELYYRPIDAIANEIHSIFDFLKFSRSSCFHISSTLPEISTTKSYRDLSCHAPLREFTLGNPDGCSFSVCGLERLSIFWETNAGLFPAFSVIFNNSGFSRPRLSQGLELLRPAAATLRYFNCKYPQERQ